MRKTLYKIKRHLRWYPLKASFRAVAQLVEHRSPKPAVGGSSPSSPASLRKNQKNKIDLKQLNL